MSLKSDPPASTTRVLGLEVCTFMPHLCNAGDAGGALGARQALYLLSPAPGPGPLF